MIKVVPYSNFHMDLFEQTDEDKKRYGEFTSETENDIAKYGTSFTVIIDGRIVLVGGILQTSVHTGKCWTMVSVHTKKHSMELVRALRKHLNEMMKDMGLRRIETANLADAHNHHKWCKFLGFKEEGLMPCYDDEGRDYIRFGKIIKEC